MTVPEFRAACAAFTVTAPVTVDDCREIYAELKPKIDAGIPLDVMCIGSDTIRVSIGVSRSMYSIELAAGAPHDTRTVARRTPG